MNTGIFSLIPTFLHLQYKFYATSHGHISKEHLVLWLQAVKMQLNQKVVVRRCCAKRCSQKTCNILKKTNVVESRFNEVHSQLPTTLLIKRFRRNFFPLNFAKIIRTHFLQNAIRRLLQIDLSFNFFQILSLLIYTQRVGLFFCC